MDWTTWDTFAVLAFVFVTFLIVLVLFEPGLRYKITPRPMAIDSEEFLRLIAALCDAEPRGSEPVEVLNNGENFYPAELAAIAAAQQSINFEAYIFADGKVAKQIVEALAERARAGVSVKLVVDYLGSLFTPNKLFDPLRAAGGRMEWYQPPHWYTFKRWNNRTHRKLIVIDGHTAFMGGADIGDNWRYKIKNDPAWRDTVFKITGDLVSGIQATFAENWLESSGEILADADYFPRTRDGTGISIEEPAGIVVNSTPSAARGTRAHILYQTLLAYAQKSIHITTPYFTPDQSSLDEMIKAAKTRGVEVIVLTPGKHSDHMMTRSSARRRYGELLKAGTHVYEYKPAMIHAKTMVIDGLWSVIGSSNFDNRSMGLNDEVNVALRDPVLAKRLEEDFQRDLGESRRITYEIWKNRKLTEKIAEFFFRIFDRQS